jgi:uncharacterized protein (DUF305 family)
MTRKTIRIAALSPILFALAFGAYAQEAGPTGNADIDFVRSLIPHHPDTLVLARTVLEQGSDPEILALAREVIAAPAQDLALMRQGLVDRGQTSV